MMRDNIVSTVVSSIDSRLFSSNALATKLFKYYIILGVLIFFVPPVINRFLLWIGLGWLMYVLFPAIVLGVVGFFIYYSISRLLHPVEKILLAVRSLEAKNMDIDVRVEGYEEVEVLARSVDRLRNSMKIATDFLGPGQKTVDSTVSHTQRFRSASTIVFSYLLYAFLLIFITGIFYNPVVYDVFLQWTWGALVVDVIVVIMALALSVSIGFVVAVRIGGPLRSLAASAERVSKGDFSASFNVAEKGELGELARGLDNIKISLERAYNEMEAGL